MATPPTERVPDPPSGARAILLRPLRRVERGRGATFNPANRYRRDSRSLEDDGWTQERRAAAAARDDGDDPAVAHDHRAQRLARHRRSPHRSIPTRAASTAASTATHGRRTPISTCRRVSTSRRELFAKPDAAKLLRSELAKPGYVCEPIALGTNTDPVPADRARMEDHALDPRGARRACEHPFTIVTKSALVERDLDLIAPMAAKRMARVFVSITTLDKTLARTLEPRAAAPQRRLQAVAHARATRACRPACMVAPIIPQLNDKDLEAILEAASQAGATHAGWVILRLPLEVAPLFRDWLATHYPLRAQHVMSLVRQIRGGRDYDATFGKRQTRQRRLRRAHPEALRGRVQAVRPERGPRAARHDEVPAAASRDAPARLVLSDAPASSPRR